MSELFLDDPIVLDPEPPPHARLSPGEWARANLFNSVVNSIITVIVGLIGGFVTWKAIAWVVSHRLHDHPRDAADLHDRAVPR